MDDVSYELDEIKEARKDVEKNSAQEKYLNEQTERLVNQVLDFMERQGIPDSMKDREAETQMILKLLEGNITPEQRQVLEARLQLLQSRRQKTRIIILAVLLLIIGAQVTLLLKKRRRRKKQIS